MTTGLYVFGEYNKRLVALFQQNKVNICRILIVRSPLWIQLIEP